MEPISLFRYQSNGYPRVRMFVTVTTWSALYLFIGSLQLKHYINPGSPVFLLGLFCFLQVSLGRREAPNSARFAWVSLAFGLLSIVLPVKTLLYLACSTGILFLVEASYGKANLSALLILLVMSPVFEYASAIFSFPLRLELTKIAAGIFSQLGENLGAEGNTLILNGNEFTVDPECMGLYMLETSLLLALLIANFYQRKLDTKTSFIKTLLILLVIFVLNIVANLLRILTLVQFNILPGNAMHEIIGLVCLLVYVLIPGSIITAKIIAWRTSKPVKILPGRVRHQPIIQMTVAAMLSISIYFVGLHGSRQQSTAGSLPVLKGYKTVRVEQDILKLSGDGSLIYIKRIPGFFAIEHNPMICWQGSGYKLSRVSVREISGTMIYTACLDRGADQLYTSWWYDNARNRTISQAEWRWDMFAGAPGYSLINLTASNPASLEFQAKQALETDLLNSAIR